MYFEYPCTNLYSTSIADYDTVDMDSELGETGESWEQKHCMWDINWSGDGYNGGFIWGFQSSQIIFVHPMLVTG